MNARSGIALIPLAGLVLVPGALAQKSPKPPKPPAVPALAIDAKPNPVVFASPTTLSGRLAGPAGVEIRLEQDATLPLGDKFESTPMTVRTANDGAYAFVVKPTVNTQYRVVAKTSPDTTGPARLVSVRPLVGLRVSSYTPRRGALVRFSGILQPAHDGLVASIQRRTSSGGWATVSRTTLRDAGDVQSTYSRRVRVRSDGVYRVKLPGHNDHVNGFSRLRTLNVR